tara:strand:- start:927 stop:2588 length:1662 start_codon:yes stop_codon:yes gene_type:complete
MKSVIQLFTFSILFLLSNQIDAQINPNQLSKIDSLFVSWNVPNHPGGAVGILKDGKTIFSKAYGLASLEYLLPNSTETIFNTGSVSKQFTAMGIVLLEEQGLLTFDDDIRKHIPELPIFKETITIRHLMHHTSGLRSLHALFALAGWRGDDSRTNDDLNRLILNQKDLNFTPGEEYLYCNTGYMLMVNIIENISGEKFTHWMKSNIFDELGMHHTYVEDEYSRVVPNNATSYYGSKTFSRAVEYWGYVGSGNMHSTTDDLLTWLQNFTTPQKGWESAFSKMLTTTPFNSGAPNSYAFGVGIGNHVGKKTVGHGGAIGGFRANVRAYSEDDLHIAVLTNFSAGNPGGKINQIGQIIYGNVEDSENSKSGELKSIDISNEKLAQHEGNYWNPKQKFGRKIYLKNDTLRYSRSETNESPIVPINSNTFKMLEVDVDLFIEFNDKNAQMIVKEEGQSASIFDGIENTGMPNLTEISEYAGKFYSPEVETFYTITRVDSSLICYHPRHGIIETEILYKDILSANWPLGIIEFERDENGNINGAFMSNGRARNVWFKKE